MPWISEKLYEILQIHTKRQLVVGVLCYLLVVGRWWYVVGCWMFVVGCCLFVIGCWWAGLLLR